MRTKSFICLAAVLAIVLVPCLAAAADVSQGKCIEYNKEKKTVTIEEYDIQFSEKFPYGQPTGQTSTYDVSKAQIGLSPEPGDILRIAYKVKGQDRMALKIMNVTKQDLRKK